MLIHAHPKVGVTFKYTMGENEKKKLRPSNVTRPIQVARAKGTEKKKIK